MKLLLNSTLLKACAIGLFWNVLAPDTDMKRDIALFTHCIFKNREMIDIYDLGPHCAQFDLLDEWTAIDACEKSDDGNDFYYKMAERTDVVSDQLVNGLAIEINDVVNAGAVNNLVEAVCDAYEPLEVRMISDNKAVKLIN
jgi:hypothetical protein